MKYLVGLVVLLFGAMFIKSKENSYIKKATDLMNIKNVSGMSVVNGSYIKEK